MSRIIDFPLETVTSKFNLKTKEQIKELNEKIISGENDHLILFRLMKPQEVFEAYSISVSFSGGKYFFKNRFGMRGLHSFDEKSEKTA